jgi:hypothetical protein
MNARAAARVQADGATERRPRRERHLQPTGSCRRPQRALVHAELTRELIERQEFGASRVLRYGHRGSLEQVRWCGPQSAVPHPKRIQRHVNQRSKFSLREIGGTTQLAKWSHDVNTMPWARGAVKRPSAYQAGSHDDFGAWPTCAGNLCAVNCSEICGSWNCAMSAQTRQTDHFVR